VKVMESRRRAALKAARAVVAHTEQANDTHYAIAHEFLDELEMALHHMDFELRRRRRLAAARSKVSGR